MMLRSATYAAAYWSGLAGREERAENAARILCFHGTPWAQAAEFERQLRYLRRQFSVVPLREIAARLRTRSADVRNLVALTFDDGLRNNLTVAYPILQKLGLPATFFVCPELAERGAWLWNHQARQRLQFAAPGLVRELAGQYAAPAQVEGFVAWMKTLGLAARRAVENALRDATPGYAPSARERHEFDLAGWEELRTLDPGVITIGSHGMSHAILTCLDAAEVEREVASSRRVLEAQLDRPVELFAYPNGDHDAVALECARRHYAAAVAGIPSWVRPASDPHLLPRMNTPRGVLRLALALHRRPGAQRGWRPNPSAAGAPL
jgi:peptidoglycan/xylan/chitin deacetylase (PgdA/CDA1 family)